MQIAFKHQDDCDLFYFCDHSLLPSCFVLFPNEIATKDLLLLIQASLDRIRPVLLVWSDPPHYDLEALKSKHFHFEKDKYIFLNYSIRNSLSRVNEGPSNISSFEQMYDVLSQYFLNISQ